MSLVWILFDLTLFEYLISVLNTHTMHRASFHLPIRYPKWLLPAVNYSVSTLNKSTWSQGASSSSSSAAEAASSSRWALHQVTSDDTDDQGDHNDHVTQRWRHQRPVAVAVAVPVPVAAAVAVAQLRVADANCTVGATRIRGRLTSAPAMQGLSTARKCRIWFTWNENMLTCIPNKV